MDMLWYATYGPSVNRDHFLEYIKGGTSNFNGQVYPGCRNKQEPIRDYAMMIPRELYFAKMVDPWGGGVAFLRPEEAKSQTIGRAYLITAEQFVDVVCQENGRRPGDPEVVLDYRHAEASKECYLTRGNPNVPLGQGKMWYGRVMRLGTRESWPVLAATAEWPGYSEINAPGRSYLKTIAAGIGQLGKISEKSLVEYFITKVGIRERISRPVLERWLV